MTQVGVHEAKTHLSRLLAQVEAGEEVIITRGGVPVARLCQVQSRGPRTFGQDRGLFVVPGDFDEPLTADVLDSFHQ